MFSSHTARRACSALCLQLEGCCFELRVPDQQTEQSSAVLRVGTRVTLVNLKAASLNGLSGVVSAERNADDRFEADLGAQGIKLIKIEHLRPATVTVDTKKATVTTSSTTKQRPATCIQPRTRRL